MQRAKKLSALLVRYRVWLLPALAGLLLRAEYLREFSHLVHFDLALGPDVAEYHARAMEILCGKIFPTLPEIHAPLYSFYLALLYQVSGASIPFVRAVTLLLNWGAWLLLLRVLHLLGASRRVRLFFLWIAMLYPPLIFHQAELISESLLLPLTALMLYGIARAMAAETPPEAARNHAAAAGIAAGLGAITHGLFLAVAAGELAGLARWGRRRLWCWFLLGCAAVILPVVAVKSAHYGRFTSIQGNAAFNLYLGNCAQADGGCWLRPGAVWRRFHAEAKKRAAQRGISVDRFYLEEVADFWLHDTGTALRVLGRKAVRIWSPRETISGADPGQLLYLTDLLFWSRGIALVLFAFAAYGALQTCRLRRGAAWSLCVLLAALVLAQLATVTSGRYRAAMLTAVIPLAAFGAAHTDWKRFWLLPALLFFVAFFVSYGAMNDHKHEAMAILAEAYFLKGDYNQAHDLALAAGRKFDDPSRLENLLGEIAQRRGDPQEAWRHYSLAAQREPERYEAWMNLANLAASSSGGAERAGELYRRAVTLEPEAALLRYNYAYFLFFGKRDYEAAEREMTAALRSNPRLAEAWNLYGQEAMRRNDPRLAAQRFARAAELSDFAPYWNNCRIAAELAKEEQLAERARRKLRR